VLPFLRVHLPGGRAQLSSAFASAARLLFGLVAGEALLPWHPASLWNAVASGLCLAALALALVRGGGAAARVPAAFAAFLGVLALLAVVTGLGGKPRSFLVLAPVLAYLQAEGLAVLRRPALRSLTVAGIVLVIACGMANLVRKEGTAKGGINDDLQAVAAFIDERSAGACSVVFTYDPGLTYVLNEADRPRRTVVSVQRDAIHDRWVGDPSFALACPPELVFVVRSYLPPFAPVRDRVDRAMEAALEAIATVEVERLSRDPAVAIKRRIPGLGSQSADLPDYRFTVYHGPSAAQVDWGELLGAFVMHWGGGAAAGPSA
jgi:hypothetical protein